MSTTDCPGGLSRIEYSKEKAKQFANEASKYDTDGIDILTFGHQVRSFNNVGAGNSDEIIQKLRADEGATMTHLVIQAAWDRHKAIGSQDQTVLFIVTDGEPSDREAVKRTIVDITNKVSDEREFNISFLTVGQITPSLQAFLTGLDDDLKGAKYDIVDVKALESVDFIQAFVGALND